MANKARYYGLVTLEQEELKKRAFRSPFINREELTEYGVYSAMSKIEDVEELSATAVTLKLKEVLVKEGFERKITAKGVKISDGVSTFTLTKSKQKGIHIVKSEYDETKRKR